MHKGERAKQRAPDKSPEAGRALEHRHCRDVGVPSVQHRPTGQRRTRAHPSIIISIIVTLLLSPSGKQAGSRPHTEVRAHAGARQRSDPAADPPAARVEGSAYASLASSTRQAAASSSPALRATDILHRTHVTVLQRTGALVRTRGEQGTDSGGATRGQAHTEIVDLTDSEDGGRPGVGCRRRRGV